MTEERQVHAAEEIGNIIARNGEYFPGMSSIGELLMAPAYLRAMGEPSLVANTDPADESYRFLCLPSFQPAMSIRIVGSNESRTVVARAWSGMPLEGHGELVLDQTRPLPPQEAAVFAELVDAARFWRLDSLGGRQGLDGASWILEGRRASGHHVVIRWSPKPAGPDRAFVHVCEYMRAVAPPLVIPPLTAEETRELDRRRREAEDARDRGGRARAAVIAQSNERAARLRRQLARGRPLTCPHCRRPSSGMRKIDRGPDAEAYFVCNLCGRSSVGPELEDAQDST